MPEKRKIKTSNGLNPKRSRKTPTPDDVQSTEPKPNGQPSVPEVSHEHGGGSNDAGLNNGILSLEVLRIGNENVQLTRSESGIRIEFRNRSYVWSPKREITPNEFDNLRNRVKAQKSIEDLRKYLAELFRFKKPEKKPKPTFSLEERKNNYDRIPIITPVDTNLIVQIGALRKAYLWYMNEVVCKKVEITKYMSICISFPQNHLKYEWHLESELSINQFHYMVSMVNERGEEELKELLREICLPVNSEATKPQNKADVENNCIIAELYEPLHAKRNQATTLPSTNSKRPKKTIMKEWTRNIDGITNEAHRQSEGWPQITKQMLHEVRRRFSNGAKPPPQKIKSVKTELRWWTKDEDAHLSCDIINAYLELIKNRSQNNELKVYATQTCFVTYLRANSPSVSNAIKNLNISTVDIILVPVHIPSILHWTMIIIHVKEKTLKYYDSLQHPPANSDIKLVAEYLKENFNLTVSEPDTISGTMSNIPEQDNGHDCGVFICMYAEFITRERKLTKNSFSQNDMKYFRMKMAYEISTNRMLTFT